ncbi:MAG: FtsX-like permease family protein [Actinomycetota bacterium]|nr:FtsX-like permease family protein [Actinomycetota bacterium]
MTWVAGLVRRRAGRTAGLVAGIALTVALVATLGSFFATSEQRMTQRSIRGVPVDWQVQLAPGTDVNRAAAQVASAPGVATTRVVSFAKVRGFGARTGGSIQRTGSGEVLGIPSGYASAFPGEIRFLVGARSGTLLQQQTAANLHATVGSRITVSRPGFPPAHLRVDGVVDLPFADSLFQKVGVPPGKSAIAPPDNVVFVPSPKWHHLFDRVAAKSQHSVWTQVHAGLVHVLPPDPGAAFAELQGRALNLEAAMAGRGTVGDNLGAQLDAARADAIYAELLFIFLGLPAVLLAAAITTVLARAGRQRRAHDHALLGLRGWTVARLKRLALVEGFVFGAVGCPAGIGIALGVSRFMLGTTSLGPTATQQALWISTAILFGLLVDGVAVVVPAWHDAKVLTVAQARETVSRRRAPLWTRTFLDIILIAAGGLVYWRAVKSGYQVVLAPEGVPTISVDYFTLLAPALLWVGAAFLIWRIGYLSLTSARKLRARVLRPLAHNLATVAAAAMSRQNRLLCRGLLIVALAAAFAVSVAVFNSTFGAQARVDAQLTNGSDVSISTTAAAGVPPQLLGRIRKVGGVAAAEPVQHRFAYVGNDLQDLYGITPSTIGRAAPISDAFFSGGTASQVLATLTSKPNAALFSDETVHDFQLRLGDHLRLRLESGASHRYRAVTFQYVGIVREFPTAPHDSFVVANASYVAQQTHLSSPQDILVKTSASPPSVAAKIRALTPPSSGLTVRDVNHQLAQTLSGLPAIDLGGLTKVELSFAFILIVSAAGLVLALGLTERRRMFAIATAVGARRRHVSAFVWSEAIFVTAGGSLLGVLLGWGVTFMLVKILTGVFDPPPEHLVVPWPYLVGIGTVMAAAVAAASILTTEASRRGAAQVIREL